jgi:hypothetical protein
MISMLSGITGWEIDFDVIKGPATILNVSQFNAGDTFKLVYIIGNHTDAIEAFAEAMHFTTVRL